MTVSRPVRGCLVGIGGYGRTHLRAFAELAEEGVARLAAVVVRNPAKYAKQVAELKANDVRCFTKYEDAIAERNFDFLVLCTPLQLHRPQVITALEAGIPVLCEKSAAPTVQDVQAMVDAQARTGVPLDIAYPQQSSDAVRALQQALIEGCIGKIERVVVRVGWLREERYYQRSAWAGRVKVDGLWTLDGPVNNPQAHYLYNGMYFASGEPGRIAEPVRVRGELYRARPTIEGEDTACIEAEFDNGVTEYFYGTLVTSDKTYADPRIDVHGDLGSFTWTRETRDSPIRITRRDGRAIEIEHGGAPGSTKRCIENFARHLLGETETLYSPVTESLKFARLSNAAFDSSGMVHQVPADYVHKYEKPLDEFKYVKKHEGEKTLVYELKGIIEAMTEAGDRPGLYSDIGLPWAVKTAAIDVTDYSHFPRAFEPGV